MRLRTHRLGLAMTLAAVAACGSESDRGPRPICTVDACDLPDDPAARSCELRRADAFNENQLGFQETALRWSCADVNGVTGVDLGQEYCEYFAIVQLPGAENSEVLGRLTRTENPDDPYDPSYSITEPALALDEPAIASLESDQAAIVGQCVFTSWNSDYAEPAMCGEEPCPGVLGVAVDEENYRMKFTVNSAEAGRFLVQDCMCGHDPTFQDCVAPDPLVGDPDDPNDPLNDDFTRGCMFNAQINQTEFRKSDSTLCASTLRLAECGCRTESGALLDVANAISPSNRRGFPLGTWSSRSELPPGCQFVDVGDGSQTVVACDLSAAEVLNRSADLKQLCREKYGPNVVVHVPISPIDIVCKPADSMSPYADTCSTTPWVVTDSADAR